MSDIGAYTCRIADDGAPLDRVARAPAPATASSPITKNDRGTANVALLFLLCTSIKTALHTTTNRSSILLENLLRRIGNGQDHAS